ncbi:DUF6221 family protein [Modestobacter sp. I12A-02662]|uniref:DUF6221 family protein n=1 Tax=Modestobacter sp. I12A-02662 TaxID=1730496 RepID=UPI0034DF091C
MDVESGLEPNLDQFLLARIAEDKRIATDAAGAIGRGDWTPADVPEESGLAGAAELVARYDPARVLAECAAKRKLVMACRDARPDLAFLGTRPRGMADFPLSPSGPHQLAAFTLAVLAMPYAGHPDYRDEWRP